LSPVLKLQDDPLDVGALDLAEMLIPLRFYDLSFVKESIGIVCRMLERLYNVSEDFFRAVVCHKAKRLGIELQPSQGFENVRLLYPPESLRHIRPEVRALLTSLGTASLATSSDTLSIDDIRVLIEGLQKGDERTAMACAGYLLDAPLDVNLGNFLRSRSAFEEIIRIALDPALPVSNRVAAASVFQTSERAVMLLNAGKEEYLPLIYSFAVYPWLNYRPRYHEGWVIWS
jgi:hypothetical protein